MQSKHSMASATVIPNRTRPRARAADGRGVADVYIGGAADGQSRLVANYVRERQRLLQARSLDHFRTASWFAHYDTDAVRAHCDAALARGEQIVLVGHSWGSDTALRAAHMLHGPIALLAGVDPVMRPGTLFSNVTHRPANAEMVVYVDARPKQMDHSDLVKATGVILGGGLAPAFRVADVTIPATLNHWAFSEMMATASPAGLTLDQMILEVGLGAPASQTG